MLNGWRSALAGGIGVLIGLALTIAVPLAGAHGGDPNLIHGCVVDASGSLRIVGPDDECRPNEYALDWLPGGASLPVEGLDTGPLPACPMPGTDTVCAARSLPAGAWRIDFRASVDAGFTAASLSPWSCDLVVGGSTVDTFAGDRLVYGSAVMLSASVDLVAESSVQVQCSSVRTFDWANQRMTAHQLAGAEVWD